jgi:histidinol-phosphate phosphatase family protein
VLSTQLDVRQLVAERADRTWCLFVDRDGVVNRRIVDDYVRSWADFEWMPKAQDALKTLRAWAPHVVVVTNQQGIGKGLMSIDDVAEIHEHVQADLAPAGVTLDGFQVCPHLESLQCSCRKPRPGLVLDWLTKHPTVEPSLSVMVGDSPSDMELAHNVASAVGGCVSIGIGGHASDNGFADASFESLWAFAVTVGNAREELDS